MVRLVYGSWLSKAVHVIISLCIPDLLRDGPKQSAELAAATGTYAPFLHRIMRALVSEGIFDADDLERFSLTPVGTTLRSDIPGSLHNWALLMLGGVHQDAWSEVLHSVRTGQNAFQHRYGMDLWEYRRKYSDHSKLFDAAMAGFTETYIVNLLD
jgi:hypothetical protein